MDCVFSRRRFSSKKLTLQLLFSNMTVLESYGSSDGYSQYLTLSLNSAPSNGVCYYVATHAGNIGIYKITNRSITQTPLKRTNNSQCGLYLKSSKTLCYYNSAYGSGSGNGSPVRNGTICLIQFPNTFDIAQVDALLQGMSTIALVSLDNNDSYPETARTNDKSCSVDFCTRADYVDAWKPNGTTYTWLSGTNAKAATASNGYLSLGVVCGGTIIGFNEPT